MKNVFSKLAVVAIAATALMSCNNQPKQNDSRLSPRHRKRLRPRPEASRSPTWRSTPS